MKNFVKNNWSIFIVVAALCMIYLFQNLSGFVRTVTLTKPVFYEEIFPQDRKVYTDYQTEQVQIPLYAYQAVTQTFFQDGVFYYVVSNHLIQQKYATSHELYSYESRPKKIFTIEKEFPYSLEVFSVTGDNLVYTTTDTRNYHRLYVHSRETKEEHIVMEWAGDELFEVVSHGGRITVLKDGVPTFFDNKGKGISYRKSKLFDNIVKNIWATGEAVAFSYEDPKGKWVKIYRPQARKITVIPLENELTKLRYTDQYLCWSTEKSNRVSIYNIDEKSLVDYQFRDPISETLIVYPYQAQFLLQGKDTDLYVIEAGKQPLKIKVPRELPRGTVVYYIDTIRTLRFINFI